MMFERETLYNEFDEFSPYASYSPPITLVDNEGQLYSFDPATQRVVQQAVERERARAAPPAAPVRPIPAAPDIQLPRPSEPTASQVDTPTYVQGEVPDPNSLNERLLRASMERRARERNLRNQIDVATGAVDEVTGQPIRPTSAPHTAESETVDSIERRQRQQNARENPVPAEELPVPYEQTIETVQQAPEAELQVAESLHPSGTAVLTFRGRNGRTVQADSGAALYSLRSQGDITQQDFEQLIGRLPPESPSGGGPGGSLVTRQFDTTVRAQPSAESLSRAGAAGKDVRAAQAAVDAGNILGAQAGVGARDRVASVTEQQAAQAQQQMQQRQRQLMERAGRLDQAINDVSTRSIDPEGYFGRGGEGFLRRLGASIAVALGSLGSDITGGPNRALDIINASIERNIQAQRGNMEHGRAMVAAQSQALGQMQSIFQDQAAAESATRALHLQAVINRLESQMAALGPDQIANAQVLRDALLNQRNAAAQIANEQGAVSMRVQTTIRDRVPTAQATAMQQQFLTPPRQAGPAAATGPSQQQVQEDSALDSLLPSTAQQTPVQQAIARDRQRRARPAQTTQRQEAQRPEIYRPPPTGIEVNPEDLGRIASSMERAGSGVGGPLQLSALRPLPGYEEIQATVRADPQMQRSLIALNRNSQRVVRNATNFFNVRREHASDIYNPTARAQMATALFNLQTAGRSLGEMGTAGSVGEMDLINGIIGIDPTGNNAMEAITRFLGSDDLDSQLRRVEGHLRSTLIDLDALAESYGYSLNTVSSTAERNTQALERGSSDRARMGNRPR